MLHNFVEAMSQSSNLKTHEKLHTRVEAMHKKRLKFMKDEEQRNVNITREEVQGAQTLRSPGTLHGAACSYHTMQCRVPAHRTYALATHAVVRKRAQRRTRDPSTRNHADHTWRPRHMHAQRVQCEPCRCSVCEACVLESPPELLIPPAVAQV